MKLFNTLSGTLDELKPLNPKQVTLYTCGPTVYDYMHIGNMRTFINNDVLKRALGYNGYLVKHVMNITDVGHLTSDGDEGEDKLEKGAKKSGKTVWEVAQFYTDFFFKTMDAVGVIRADVISKATEHIPQMIDLIKQLETKGYTYQTNEGVYFDVAKFSQYGKLSKQNLEDKKQAVRQEVHVDPDKKHPADFSLWFKRAGRFADHAMHWESPWGDGFPGWHVECSAMAMQYLGETIDIHTGGIDHIPVHHENEIAQSEAATGKPFVNIWMHHNFLTVDGQKMSKSLGNFYTIDDIIKKGIEPAAVRLLFLQTHYSQAMNFTWESAQAAQEAFQNLKDRIADLKSGNSRTMLSEEKLKTIEIFQKQFSEALNDNLQTPRAVATMWEMLKSNIPSEDKLDLLYQFDQVLGLRLQALEDAVIPEPIKYLAQRRDIARRAKKFAESDALRKQIQDAGYEVEDIANGFRVKKK